MPVESDLRTVWPRPEEDQNSSFDHKIDIVFVHGLNPSGNEHSGRKTWTTATGVSWPQDLLPSKIKFARIMLFEYNSTVRADASEIDLRGHAEALLDSVQREQEKASSVNSSDTTLRPIIFIGHSLGGLLIKQALVLAKQNDRTYGGLLRCTKGIVFFATPHRGGNGATLGKIVANAYSFMVGSARNELVKSLKEKSKSLAQLSADFSHQYENYQFLSVIESRPLIMAPMNPIRTVIVDRSSAILGLAGHREQVLELDRNHVQICKFEEGPDFSRVIWQLEKMARFAVSNLASSMSRGVGAALTETHSRPPTEDTKHSLGRFRPYCTIEFIKDKPLHGHDDLLRWLELFVQHQVESCLILCGPSGIGKSAIAYNFVKRFCNSMSVFWFAAESPQSIDRDLQATSRMINSAQPSKSPLEPRAFRSWLSKECREPWLVILDNAYEGLDVRDLVPPTGGKTVVTAKHAAVLTHNKFVSKQVPPLRLEHAWSLFISSCSTRLDPAPSRLPMPSTAAPVLERLANRPIAICLAAAVMGAVNSGNPAQDLQNFQDQQVIGEDSLDFSVWKWSYLLLSQLNPSESFLIGLICVFNSEWVSDAFIDLIAKSASPNSIFYRRQHTRSFNRLLQLRLVQRRSNFTQQYYYVPSAIKECTVRYLKIIHIHGGIQRVLQEAFDIVHSIFGTIRLGTGSDGSQSLEILSPHIQALCIRAKKEDFDLPNSLQHHLFRVCHFALKEATQQIERFCHKQYWRTWLLSNNCSLNEANQGEDDGSDLIIHPIYHEWIDLRSTAHCKAHRDVRHLLQEDIVSNFMDDLNKSTVLAAIGSAWHGVRDEIFDFIRNHECARKDDGQIKLIIDAVDKGGCEGLQCATVEQLRSDEYISEVSEDSSRALDSLVDIIAAAITASGINILHCSSEILSAVKGALNESWETLRLSSFYQMCGAFESVLSGQTVSLVRSIVESALTSNAQLDGFENPTAFAVQTMGNGPLKSRISLVSQGYWNVTSALTFFIASGMLRDLSAVALDTGSDMRNPEAVSEHLMTWAIDLLRAGIMSCGLQYSPVWKLALKDAVFRCVQVEECRGAWGGISGSYKYSTQDQWEEYQLLL